MIIMPKKKKTVERSKGVIFKNCAPFNYCICSVNYIQIYNVEYLDVAMTMYTLIEYSYNSNKYLIEYSYNSYKYLKTSRSLWQYCRDDPNYDVIQSESFKYKI